MLNAKELLLSRPQPEKIPVTFRLNGHMKSLMIVIA